MLAVINIDTSCEILDLARSAALAETLVGLLIAAVSGGLAPHFVEGYQAGATAVAACTFYCQRNQNPMQCRSHIRNAGLPIRLEV